MSERASSFRLGCIVGDEEAAGELLQPQEFGQHRGCGDLPAVVQLGEAVPPQTVVDGPLFGREDDAPGLECLLRQVQGFLFGHPVGDGMLFADEFVEVLVLDDLLAVEAAHHGVAVAEGVEVGAEDGRVEEAVLTENVHRLVLHRGAGENQLVPGLVAQLVH